MSRRWSLLLATAALGVTASGASFGINLSGAAAGSTDSANNFFVLQAEPLVFARIDGPALFTTLEAVPGIALIATGPRQSMTVNTIFDQVFSLRQEFAAAGSLAGFSAPLREPGGSLIFDGTVFAGEFTSPFDLTFLPDGNCPLQAICTGQFIFFEQFRLTGDGLNATVANYFGLPPDSRGGIGNFGGQFNGTMNTATGETGTLGPLQNGVFQFVTIPEPGALALVSAGLLTLLARRIR